MPIGAEVISGGTHFRVWAPKLARLAIVLEKGTRVELASEAGGYFSGYCEGASAGDLYWLEAGGKRIPDPASRFQPQGVHGPSQIIDATAFNWKDGEWLGVKPYGRIIYEMHIGCFTPEGTWRAAIEKLPHLRDMGIDLLEVMPVAAFAGKRNWGYDGVDLFSPTENYGTPDEFREFVDRAHQLGIGVLLDVVYNHLGPDGNYLPDLSDHYFSDKHANDWGRSINFDDEGSDAVREFFIANACYWMREFHLDGIRFDATQAIKDNSETHILAEIGRAARDAANEVREGKTIYLVNENEPQETDLIRPIDQGGYGLDASWNDDFHHTARVALTGRRDAYYTDYHGTTQEMISALKWGYLYQGQFYGWQQKRRGTPSLDLPPHAFVHYIQNHDQIANFGHGERINRLASPPQLRAITTLLLLAPQTPMLFMGQEWGAASKFLFFGDHKGKLADMVDNGRKEEMSQFPSVSDPEMLAMLPRPDAIETFEQARLDWGELERVEHKQMLALHRDLIALRKSDPVFSAKPRRGGLDGAMIGDRACVVRFFAEDGMDRLIILNMDGEEHLSIVPEPLLAPPGGMEWEMLFCSDHPRYGGTGCVFPETRMELWRLPGENWRLPGRSAMVLKPVPRGTKYATVLDTKSPSERIKDAKATQGNP
jgi:maltooligosyltrehalose trehalohydrolase